MLSSVETVAKLVQVLLKMFLTQPMIGTHNKSSKIADKRVYMLEYRVRSTSSDHPRVMRKSMALKGWIYRQAIGANSASRFDNCFGELYDCGRIDLFHGLQSGIPNIFLAALPFEKRYRNEYRGLVGTPFPFSSLCRGSNKQFVHFHRFGKLILRVPFRHSVTDTLKYSPSRIVIHADMLRQQQGGVASLVRSNEEDGEKPALQRSACFVENRSSRGRIEMETESALVHSSGGNARVKVGLATHAASHAFRPAHSDEVIFASRLCRKGGKEVHKIQWLVGVDHYSTVPRQKVFSALTR